MSVLNYGETFGRVVTGLLPDVTLSVHAAETTLQPHEHTSAYICVVVAGGFRERQAKAAMDYRPGDVIVHPGGERHADIFGPLGAYCLNVHLRENVVQPATRRAEPELAAVIQQLAAETAKGTIGDCLTSQSLLAELVHRIEKPVWTQSADCVSRVLGVLNDAPTINWSLQALAKIVERHPTHLARAFKVSTGITIGTYRRRQRLIRLCLNLRSGTEQLSELALEHGYADQAHMTREFKDFAGLTPAAYRRQLR